MEGFRVHGNGRFSEPVLTQGLFGAGPQAGGWSANDLFPRTFADVNGDGTCDIVGFGDAGVQVSLAGYDW